ncbi:TPA: hypothetical protein EYP66_09380 [Candidatus Poribacteria bacterium]|nr:hypothetical protein [Candidatus Poribacteria bacterium]
MNKNKFFTLISRKIILLIGITLPLLFLTQCGCRADDDKKIEKWTFVVYSDNRGSNPTHRAVLASIAKIKPDLILNLGDMVFRGEEYGTLESFKTDIEKTWGDFDSFNRIFYPTIGGHEERYYNQSPYPPHGKEPDNQAGQKLYRDLAIKKRVAKFNKKYGDYYFKHKNVHFIMIYRSDEWKVKDQQVEWLKDILNSIKDDDPIVVTGHAGGWFLSNVEDANHETVRKLLREYNVDIELAADWHDYYADTDGDILRMRSGSAGWGDAVFIQFDVTDKNFTITAFEPDGVTPFTGREWISPRWIKEFGKPALKR